MITRKDLNIIMMAIGTCSGCQYLNKTNCIAKKGMTGCLRESEYMATDEFVEFINTSIEEGKPIGRKGILELNHNWYQKHLDAYKKGENND